MNLFCYNEAIWFSCILWKVNYICLKYEVGNLDMEILLLNSLKLMGHIKFGILENVHQLFFIIWHKLIYDVFACVVDTPYNDLILGTPSNKPRIGYHSWCRNQYMMSPFWRVFVCDLWLSRCIDRFRFVVWFLTPYHTFVGYMCICRSYEHPRGQWRIQD